MQPPTREYWPRHGRPGREARGPAGVPSSDGVEPRANVVAVHVHWRGRGGEGRREGWVRERGREGEGGREGGVRERGEGEGG